MNEVEALIVARAANMADHDGVALQIVHIFGAANQLTAELGSARDRLIGQPGLIADTLSDPAEAEVEVASANEPVAAAESAPAKSTRKTK